MTIEKETMKQILLVIAGGLVITIVAGFVLFVRDLTSEEWRG
jgi:hypothetical protein